MPDKSVADVFHTKKLCSRLFQAKCDFRQKNGHFEVFEPPLESLGASTMIILGSLENG